MRTSVGIVFCAVWTLAALPASASPCDPDEREEIADLADDLDEVAAWFADWEWVETTSSEERQLSQILSDLTRMADSVAAGERDPQQRRLAANIASASRKAQARMRGRDLDALVDSYESLVDRLDDLVGYCDDLGSGPPIPRTAKSPAPAPKAKPAAAPAPKPKPTPAVAPAPTATATAQPAGQVPPQAPRRVAAASVATGGEPAAMAGMLAAHNRARAEVQSPAGPLPPLTWSAEVASVAQTWSNQLAASGCGFRHSTGSGYGENIAMFSQPTTAERVVGIWLEERACYTYAPSGSQGECRTPCSSCGHYTQLVWRDTTKLGCGAATCANGNQIWTCNYDPPGNFTGRTPY